MKLLSTDPWSYVRGIQPVSLCDWPGRVSMVLFLGSCNLSCPTCHNRELARNPENLPPVPREKVLAFLRSRHPWLDGVVLSGGEPAWVPGVEEICAAIREAGQAVKLDSNGLSPEVLEDVLEEGLVQQVAVDLKGPWGKYPELTGGGCSPQEAERAFSAVFELAKRFAPRIWFRCTWVPALSPEDIQTVRSYLPRDHELVLQDYVPVGKG